MQNRNGTKLLIASCCLFSSSCISNLLDVSTSLIFFILRRRHRDASSNRMRHSRDTRVHVSTSDIEFFVMIRFALHCAFFSSSNVNLIKLEFRNLLVNSGKYPGTITNTSPFAIVGSLTCSLPTSHSLLLQYTRNSLENRRHCWSFLRPLDWLLGIRHTYSRHPHAHGRNGVLLAYAQAPLGRIPE